MVEIVRRPSLVASLRNEVHQAIAALSPPTLSTLLHLPQAELVTTLPQINAAFQETLRFHVSTFSLRLIEVETVLPASLCGNETGLRMKKGEELICVTRMNSIDHEGDWGNDADKWEPERFLDGKGRKGTMSPFGGGVSMVSGLVISRSPLKCVVPCSARVCVYILRD